MIPQILLNGLVMGMMIALMAIGLSLIYGIMRVVNFAHGEFYMFGAVIVFFLIMQIGVSFILASVIALGTMGLLGWILDKLVFRRFRGAVVEGSIAAIALSVGFQSIAWVIFGPIPKGIPSIITGRVEIFGAVMTAERLLVAGVSLVVIVVLAWIIGYTKLGKSMRAVQQDSEAALTQGISVTNICAITFAIATTLAALAGVLVAPIYSVNPVMGFVPLTFALIVVILGGMGSVLGAFIASLIIGFQQSLTGTLLSTELAMGIAFGLAMLILIIRPKGLMGYE